MGNLLVNAIELATRAHTGQVDKSGHAYIAHPLRVMAAVSVLPFKNQEYRLKLMIAAVLHDVPEDTTTPLSLIYDMFGVFTGDIVDAVTRRKPLGESYGKYIDRLALNDSAIVIKRADVLDNLGRLGQIIDRGKYIKLYCRYHGTLDKFREPMYWRVDGQHTREANL